MPLAIPLYNEDGVVMYIVYSSNIQYNFIAKLSKTHYGTTSDGRGRLRLEHAKLAFRSFTYLQFQAKIPL
jgi:hypothetical protein